jgi:ribosomal protein S9
MKRERRRIKIVRMNQLTQYSSHERASMVFATRKLMRMFCCRKSRRQVQIDADVQACGIVAMATAARFNMLRMLVFSATWSYCFTVSGCGYGHRYAV